MQSKSPLFISSSFGMEDSMKGFAHYRNIAINLAKVLALLTILSPSLAVSATNSWWRKGLMSEAGNKINELDQLPTTNIPIPVLLGVEVSNLTKNFGDPRSGGTRSHEGLDIMSPLGTPIASPTDAVVVSTGNGGSAGLYVRTSNPGGETFVYMHLSSIAKGIERGKILSKGDVIGFVGNTGNASGGATHLHFEIRKGSATDPFPRLTSTFTLEERMKSLAQAVEKTDDSTLASKWVSNFKRTLLDAKSAGLALPQSIISLLDNSSGTETTQATTKTVVETGNPTVTDFSRNLTLGSVGDDVKRLQEFLNGHDFIVAKTGVGSPGSETNYFGNLTRQALARYQAFHGILPSAGYFGPITRGYIST